MSPEGLKFEAEGRKWGRSLWEGQLEGLGSAVSRAGKNLGFLEKVFRFLKVF